MAIQDFLNSVLLSGARVMITRLGLARTVRVGWAMQTAGRRGEPFAGLPAPDCDPERQSREQIGPAILLYRELIPLLGQPEALQVTRDVAVAGAVAFLGQSVGHLRRKELQALAEQERQAFVKQRGERFFNATIRWDCITPEEVRFTVLSCRFPVLCEAAGAPELAPIFCQGDAVFFGEVEPDVTLERPHTIAEGAATCPFSLRLGGER